MRLEKRKFKLADENGDEKLDKDEFAAYMMPQHYARMMEFEVERLKSKLDKNYDGKISFLEFRADRVPLLILLLLIFSYKVCYLLDIWIHFSFVESGFSYDRDAYEMKKFKAYDTNGDEELELDEFKKWVNLHNFRIK